MKNEESALNCLLIHTVHTTEWYDYLRMVTYAVDDQIMSTTTKMR